VTHHRSRPATILVAILSLLIAGVGFSSAASKARADSSTPPPVLPALQQWSTGSGSGYSWTAGGRIVVNTADASALTADAQTFADDLALDLNAATPQIVQGTLASASPGDIFLSLGSTNTQLGTEGYALTVAPVLQVSATAETGAFWATRTILQMLRQNLNLPAGTAVDWPKYKVRSMLVDNGARTFPVHFWENEIRELSYLKLNELMVYISGLGLTNAELQGLSTFAASYHVNLVGQVNVPGHMDTARENIPAQYELLDPNSTTGGRISGALDLTNPSAVAWAQQLVSQYIDQFSTPIWHMGGDEYATACQKMDPNSTLLPQLTNYAKSLFGPNGTIQDVYRTFADHMDALIRQHGKSMRMWNDDLFPTSSVTLSPDITVEYWLHAFTYNSSCDITFSTPAQIAANGNQLVNASAGSLYYNEGNQSMGTAPSIWEQFDPGTFDGGLKLPGGDNDPHLAGIKMSVWNSGDYDIGQLERDLKDRQRALSQKAWGSTELYPTYAAMGPVLDAIGRAPGFLDTPAVGDPGYGGTLSSSQAIMFDNAEHTFTVQPDGSVKHSWYSFTTQGPYATEVVAPAGSATIGSLPTAFASPGQMHVYVRGSNGHLLHWVTGSVSGRWGADDWTASAQAGGSPYTDIAGNPGGFVYNGIGGVQQQIFARGSDGTLHHWVYSVKNNKVSAGADWGGRLTGNPSPVIWGEVQAVFARGTDGRLRMWWWQTSDPDYVHQQEWGGPQLASDASPLALAGAVDGVGNPSDDIDLHVYARDTAGHLQHWVFDPQAGGSPTVEDLTAASGFSIAGDPSGFTYIGQQHVYFGDAATGHLDHVWTKPGVAPAWQDVSASTPGGVVDLVGNSFADNVNNAEQHAFGFDSAGHVHNWFWVQSTDSLHQDTWQQ